MNRVHKMIFWIIMALWVIPAVVLAQGEDCPAIVRTALASVDQTCEGTGRNQACYGNLLLIAEPQPDVNEFAFSEAGDIVDLWKVRSLQLHALDTVTQEWGVALMKLQANLPETLPGQNVTILLFGDVQITDATAGSAPAPVLLNVTASQSINVRSGPSTGDAVVSALQAGQTVTADARSDAADWVRIQLPDESGAVNLGWVFAELVTVEGDAMTLPVKDASDTEPASAVSQYGPMQSFYFKSGVGDAPCAEAPDSGILIQTPEGSGRVFLQVNGANIELGSTAFLQASSELTVNLVEGGGSIEADGQTRTIPAGSRVRVPLAVQDGNLVVSGPPGDPEPYQDEALQTLPVQLLEREITVTPALTVEEIEELTASPIPMGGPWQLVMGQVSFGGGCPAELTQAASMFGPDFNTTVTFPDGPIDMEQFLLSSDADLPPNMTVSNPEPGLVVMDFSEEGVTARYEFRVISSTLIQAQMVISFEGCDITYPWEMTPIGG